MTPSETGFRLNPGSRRPVSCDTGTCMLGGLLAQWNCKLNKERILQHAGTARTRPLPRATCAPARFRVRARSATLHQLRAGVEREVSVVCVAVGNVRCVVVGVGCKTTL